MAAVAHAMCSVVTRGSMAGVTDQRWVVALICQQSCNQECVSALLAARCTGNAQAAALRLAPAFLLRLAGLPGASLASASSTAAAALLMLPADWVASASGCLAACAGLAAMASASSLVAWGFTLATALGLPLPLTAGEVAALRSAAALALRIFCTHRSCTRHRGRGSTNGGAAAACLPALIPGGLHGSSLQLLLPGRISPSGTGRDRAHRQVQAHFQQVPSLVLQHVTQ